MITAGCPRADALAILRANDRGRYSVPTHGLYPVQFNWDSAFAALGYQRLDPDRALAELEILAAAQWPDGMIPHIIFRGDHQGYFPGPEVWRTDRVPPTSGITQPPVLASALRALVERGLAVDDIRLEPLLRRLLRWHRWFLDTRLDRVTGTLFVTHPWESGRDNLVDWDVAMARIVPADLPAYERIDLQHVDAAQRPGKADYDRYLTIIAHGASVGWDQVVFGRTSPFRMADPGTTAILMRANRDLEGLLRRAGLPAEAAEAAELHGPFASAFDALWNEGVGAYTARDPATGAHGSGVSSAAFLAPYAGITDPARLGPLMDHFDRIAGQVRFMVPSYDPADAGFDPKRYWRGPVWHVVNRLIGEGLEEIGEGARAARIRRDSAALIEAFGFREYFSPMTGEGLGGQAFTWTAATYLDWVLGT